VNLRVEGRPGKLPPGVDLTAYRIVQEALTNTVKHSGADEATVTVRYEPGYVTVSVTDTGNAAVAVTLGRQVRRPRLADGAGARPAASGGFGLAGIAERVASCGGSLTVGPGDGGGFAVTARLPAP
jgi:signal transduction histidine kinase